MQLKVPVIGILRGIRAEDFTPLMQAGFAAGLDGIEVTMNTHGAEEIIRANRSQVPVGKFLGMGTIRNLAEAETALRAGAMFIVSPNVDQEVIAHARKKDIPIIAGALTPTEVYRAWTAGAVLIKVFPCRALGGPHYIRELKGPFDHIPLMAVGGVTRSNAGAYFEAGAAAVGVGMSLFGEKDVQQKNWQAVARNVMQFISQCPQV